MPEMQPLTGDDIAHMEHRARRFQGAWTGTSGEPRPVPSSVAKPHCVWSVRAISVSVS